VLVLASGQLVAWTMMHKDLATMVGKTPNATTRICENDFQPTLKLLRDIARAPDVSICELLIDPRPQKNSY